MTVHGHIVSRGFGKFALVAALAVTILAPASTVPARAAHVGVVIYAPGAPPPVRVERRPYRPYPGAVWISGRWAWRHGAWVWVGGRWTRPHPGYHHWVPGHWASRPRGYVWVEGHWR